MSGTSGFRFVSAFALLVAILFGGWSLARTPASAAADPTIGPAPTSTPGGPRWATAVHPTSTPGGPIFATAVHPTPAATWATAVPVESTP